MCFPAVAGILGAAVSAFGSIAQGAMQSASYKAQAKFAERQRSIELQKGAYEAKRQQERADQLMGRQRAQYLASGIGLTGSAAGIIESTAVESSLDEQAIKYGAQIKADNYTFEARLAKMNASNTMAGSIIGAISPMINAFSNISSNNQQRTMIQSAYG